MISTRPLQRRTVAHAASLCVFRFADCRTRSPLRPSWQHGLRQPRHLHQAAAWRDTGSVRAATRDGMTLLEIILALTIFFGAMAALSQLAWNGSRAAVQARLRTQAIIRCEAKLAEVIAGAEALQPKTRVSFSDNAQWTYSITVAESQYPDLMQVQVTVAHTGNSSLANVEFSLSRWMRDPSLFLDAAELQKTEAEKESQTKGATQ